MLHFANIGPSGLIQSKQFFFSLSSLFQHLKIRFSTETPIFFSGLPIIRIFTL